jgi:hypothetical protein
MSGNRIQELCKKSAAVGKSYCADFSGNTAIIFGLALPVLLVGAGAATMYGYEIKTQTELQAAVDAGALAGTALTAEASDKQRIAAAIAAFKGNFAGDSGFSQGSSDYTVSDGSPIPKFTVSNWEVSGEAVATIKNPFGGIIGQPELKVRVNATGAKMESEPVCVLGLDPEQEATIDMAGQPKLTAKDCAVQANSKNGAGIRQKGKPQLKAKTIGTTGGFTGQGYDPTPIKGTIPVPDPYAGLKFPDYSSCDFNNVIVSSETRALKPGTYCGGIRIKAGGVANLQPGVYVIKDGPVWINGNGTIHGEQVLIAFTGPDATLYMEGGSTLDLTSPIKGTYANMQFMQQPGTGGDDLYFSIIGDNSFSVEGAIYLPTLDVWFGGGTIATISSPTYALVADKIWIQDQTEITVTLENKRNIDVSLLGRIRFGARLIR